MTILSFLAQVNTRYPTLRTDDIERLLENLLDKNTAYLRAFPEHELTSAQVQTLTLQLSSLEQGTPLAYLIGHQAFWDMELRVNEHTLIPRPDTEILVERVKMCVEKHFPANATCSMLDLGTGSGAIAIALSRLFPDASIVATDISAEALAVAKVNAKNWSSAPISFVQTSWLSDIHECVDIIVSNPPYIASDDEHLCDLAHEPQTALTAGKDGLDDIRAIIADAPRCLHENGWLFLEHGYDQGDAVRALFSDAVWHISTTVKDYGGNDRVTFAQLKQ